MIKDAFIEQLRLTLDKGLSIDALIREYPRLIDQGADLYGSWGNAVRACGGVGKFDFRIAPIRFRASRMAVAGRLIDWAAQHGPVSDDVVGNTDPELNEEIVSTFGSPAKLAERLGIPVIPEFDLDKTIPCLICGEEFTSLITHITRIHDMSCQEYKERFGVSHVVAPATRQKLSGGGSFEPLTREEIVIKLREFARVNPRMTSTWLRERDPKLERQVRYLWGSWRDVCEVLGIKATQEVWSNRKIFSQVRSYMKRHDVDVVYASDISKYNECLYQAICRKYSNWATFTTALGLDPEACRLRRTWSREGALQALCEWSAVNGTLGTSRLLETDSALYHAVLTYCGSLEASCQELGLPYERQREVWTPPLVLERIRELHKTESGLLTQTAADAAYPTLSNSARRFFGSWTKAKEVAGIDETDWRKNPRQLAERLRKWMAEHGELRSTTLRKTDSILAGALRRRYGSLEIAAKALNIVYKQKNKKWTQETLIERLREMHNDKISLTPENLRNTHSGVSVAVRKHFGTLSDAIKAAGLRKMIVKKRRSCP